MHFLSYLQGLSGSDVENVGYVIPTPVVNHFLTDYLSNGKFTGFPALGVQWQRMESDALKRAYKMKPGQKGGEHRCWHGSSEGLPVQTLAYTTGCTSCASLSMMQVSGCLTSRTLIYSRYVVATRLCWPVAFMCTC